MRAYKGNILYTKEFGKLEIIENGYVVVNEQGEVMAVEEKIASNIDIINYGDKLIIPGFVDLHFHAPQYPNIGLGMDMELLPWLNNYTFKEEAKYSDLGYALNVYSKAIDKIINAGTTSVVLWSTIHKEATNKLIDICIDKGIRAYVGKVNMDRNSPEYLIETTEDSINDTIDFVKTNIDKSELVKPIITPRFVPSCSDELMDKLGEIARENNLPIQSHLSENKDEIKWVKELDEEALNYASVYKKHDLLNDKTIMAHCVHNTEDEIKLMEDTGMFIAHCPNANYNLASGIAPIRKYLKNNINIGLGTDVGAGNSVSIRNVMVSALQSSKMKWYENKNDKYLTTEEIFYLATKGGGKFFGKVGSFEKGYSFDALIIDDVDINDLGNLNLKERLQKFIYTGSNKNIIQTYINGEAI